MAFAEKGMGIVSTFMILQDKCFSQYVLLNDQILLFDWLYFLGNMCIAIVCDYCNCCGVLNFEINLAFLHNQNVKAKKLKNLENEKSF